MSGFFLEFLTRRQCPLCHEAERVVTKVGRWTATPTRFVDIDSDPDLAVDFGLRIPVVRGPDGAVLGEGHVGQMPLLRAVVRARVRWLLHR